VCLSLSITFIVVNLRVMVVAYPKRGAPLEALPMYAPALPSNIRLGWKCQAAIDNDCNEHSSLLRSGINYDRKKL